MLKKANSMGLMVYDIKQASGLGISTYISLSPSKDMGIEEVINYLEGRPNDKFMVSHLIKLLRGLPSQKVERLIGVAKRDKNFLLLSCLYEACYSEHPSLLKRFKDIDMAALAKYSPLVYTRWLLGKNLKSCRYWMEIFFKNKYNYELLPSLKDIKHPIPFDLKSLDRDKEAIHIEELYSKPARYSALAGGSDNRSFNVGTSLRAVPPKETINRVLKKSIVKKMFIGDEEKVLNSVSPYSFKRDFKIDVKVAVERNRYKIKGHLASRGKGKDEQEAKASYLMEFVERYSASASFYNNQSMGYKREFKLIKSRYSDLRNKGVNVLDPNKMNLEVPYKDESLYWICAEELDKNGSHKIYAPAQFAFWLSSENFDEVDLLSGSTSNGLASGNTMDEAKLHGVLEYIERYLDKVSCYCPSKCFSLITEEEEIAKILTGLKKKDIYIYFLDLTNDWGIPCYKAFIKSVIEKTSITSTGCGAHLDGKIAALRALYELTYSSKYGPLISPPQGLFKTIRELRYEELPNYSSGNIAKDLHTLEKLLIMNGFGIIYIDLTRNDLDIPVVRVIIPGLEILPELNLLSNFNKELFRNYLQIVKARDESVDEQTQKSLEIKIPHTCQRLIKRYTNHLARLLGPGYRSKIEGYLKKEVKEIIEKMGYSEGTKEISTVLNEIKKILEEEHRKGNAKEALNFLIKHNYLAAD